MSLDSELHGLHLLINFIFNSLASEGDVFKNGTGDHFGINVSSIDLGCQVTVTVFVTFHRWFPDIILPQFNRRATEKKVTLHRM